MDGQLTAREVEDLLVESDPLVVDVRDEQSYRARHIPGSEHVPFAEIPKESDRIAEADHVVTVCYEGIASAKAARLIASHKDFDGVVENLSGGMDAWEGPVDSDGASPGTSGGGGAADAADASDPPF
jgi:rhodanese-related sulfurtransferase